MTSCAVPASGLSRDELVALWEEHIATEFTEKSAERAVSTMVPHATVNHVPTQTVSAVAPDAQRPARARQRV